jgi:ABC-type nitrate/sulfonate/bicarbonate transport system permease component
MVQHAWGKSGGGMKISTTIKGIAGGILAVAIWQIVISAHIVDQRLFPGPDRVLMALLSEAREGILLQDVSATLFRILTGFTIGAAIGFSVGITTALWQRGGPFFEPVLNALRPIPAVSLVPLAIVWFGIGEIQKLFIVSWAAFFPVWINTHIGIRKVPQIMQWTAHVFTHRRRRVVLELLVPFASPFIYAGARIALAFAFSATVVAEMSGANAGLGYRVLSSHVVFAVDRMMASIVVIGLLGFTADRVFASAGRRLFDWALD